ncbi:hypothetical protein CBR_g50682 [Chara braunii]|uniref:Uncharacterized protein n=1 Tax=Chara braunii TaxID=69332 RepID=A0A388M7E9_CHABU|nr:hypothetical protein CBR_g50682 [Chara braunii]|eukprot:GBG90435.1 hypothetical protein CBR_g50682 [Chara braunii]
MHKQVCSRVLRGDRKVCRSRVPYAVFEQTEGGCSGSSGLKIMTSSNTSSRRSGQLPPLKRNRPKLLE